MEKSSRNRSRTARVARSALCTSVAMAACLLAAPPLVAADGQDAPPATPPAALSAAAARPLPLADQPLEFDTNLGLMERATAEAVGEALKGLKLEPGSDIRLHSLTNHEASWFVEDYIARYLSGLGFNVHLAKVAAPGPVNYPGTVPVPPPGGSGRIGSTAGGGLSAAIGSTNPAPATSGASTSVAGAAGADSASGDSAHAAAVPPAGAGTSTTQAPAGPAGQAATGPRGGPGKAEEAYDPNDIIPPPEGEGLVLTFRLIEFGVTYNDSWKRGLFGPRVVERLASVNVYCRLVNGSAENVVWVGSGKAERLDVVPKAKLELLEGMTYPFKQPTLRPQPLSRFLEPALVVGIVGGLIYLFYSNQK